MASREPKFVTVSVCRPAAVVVGRMREFDLTMPGLTSITKIENASGDLPARHGESHRISMAGLLLTAALQIRGGRAVLEQS